MCDGPQRGTDSQSVQFSRIENLLYNKETRGIPRRCRVVHCSMGVAHDHLLNHPSGWYT